MERTIAEDMRAGTSTGGRIIIGPHGVLPSADPIIVEPLMAAQKKALAETQAQQRDDLAYLAAQDEFAQRELAQGIGKHYAYVVQNYIRNMSNHEAGKMIGLSYRAVARLRTCKPFDIVPIGFPRP